MVQNKLTGTSLHGIIGPIVEAITILHPRQERPGRTIDTSLVLGIGPAGCGKTLFACLQAIQDLQDNKINKIILSVLA